LNESREDYLEVIYTLIRDKGRARTGEISKILNVTPASVTEMLQKLEKEKLVFYEKYKGVILTKEGEKIAKKIRKKHEILVKFLKFLGVSEEVAEKDACKMEHVLQSETMEKLEEFIEKLVG